MTLLETRLGQTERRIEREMTQIHSKMDDVFRSIPDKSYVFSFIFLYRLVQSTISVQSVDILSHLITEKKLPFARNGFQPWSIDERNETDPGSAQRDRRDPSGKESGIQSDPR